MLRGFLGLKSQSARQGGYRVAEGERLYAVGDIHGRNDLLVAMLDKIGRDIQRFDDDRTPRIVFLGDYIDRGDHSAQVLDTLCESQVELGPVVEFLMGNHEAALLAFLDDPVAGEDWIGWGGLQTLGSYGVAVKSSAPDKANLIPLRDALQEKMPKSHLTFLKGLKRHVVSGDVVCIHASADPEVPIGSQTDDALLWGYVASGKTSSLPGHRLVHGHFADDAPVVQADRICVDTGAYYTGRLTAVRLDDGEEMLQVDFRDVT